MNAETKTQLSKLFIPRDYQKSVQDALFNTPSFKKIFLLWHRRSGKDVVAFNAIIRAAALKTGVYYYCLPTYSHGRKVLFEGLLSDGRKFLDFIPKGLIKKINQQDMAITLVNDSRIQIVGSDTAAQTLVGTNPMGIVFSEWSISNPEAYSYIRPALLYNDGFAIFIGTPRGYNHFYEMYNIAQSSPEWFCSVKTIHDTHAISAQALASERDSMSQDLFEQEYEVSFSAGISGSFWGRQMDTMRLESRITSVPYEPGFPVYTSFDLGVSDPTCIIFFQCIGQIVRIIDYHEDVDYGLDHYAKVLDEKGYKYAKHFFPHDIRVREIGAKGAQSREQTARDLGFVFDIVPNVSIEDGIEAVRMSMAKWWIDEKKCAKLVKALDSYRREYDSEKKVYRNRPLHDGASHPADSARMLALSLPSCSLGTSQEELTRMYQQAKFGVNNNTPPVFRDNKYNQGSNWR